MDDSTTPAPFPRDDDARSRGLERMSEVYSFDVADGPGDFFGYTVEHLFADIWERPGLSLRDRRLLLLGLMCTESLDGVAGIQVESALAKGDLSPAELREVVIFLSHYAGWPKGAALNTTVETAIARYEKAQRAAADGDAGGAA
ncbi:MAG: carboxymuconolactone decarboxylase family protein [Actinomycetes bacterium]